MKNVFHFPAFAIGMTMLCALATFDTANAQSYPQGQIRFVISAGPGTPPDIIARAVTNEIVEREGWRIVVENKPGGSTTVAGIDVARQPADGMSILAVSLPGITAPMLLPNVPYSFEKDFVPVIKASISYNVLVVNPSVPANSVSELVALLKSKPDQLSYSSGGIGTPAHLIGELFKLETGTRATHVPYPGGLAKPIADLLNGTNQFMFIATLPVVELVNSGQLRALAVSSPKRVEALKQVPTIVEQGFPNLVVADEVGFVVRAGTPPDVVERLNAAMNRAIASDKVRDAFAKLGAEPVGGTSQDYGADLKSETAYWTNVITKANLKIQP